MTMLPPPNGHHERDTEPPERSRESTAPPADLGPTGLALRLLALEEQVSDIHAETLGTSKTLETISRQLTVMRAYVERTSSNVDILKNDARNQRDERARMRADLDELESRVTNVIEEDS